MPWYGICDNFGSPNFDTDLSSGYLGPRYSQINLNGDAVAAGDGIKTVLRTSGDFDTSCAYAASMTPGYSTWTGFLGNQGGVLAVHDCDAVTLGSDGVPLGRWTESLLLGLKTWLPAASTQGDVTIGTGTANVGLESGMVGIAITSSATPPYMMVLMNRSVSNRVSFYAVRVTSHGDPPTVELLASAEDAVDYEDGGVAEIYWSMGRIHIYYPSADAYDPIILEGFSSPDLTAYSVIHPGIYIEQGGANAIYVDDFKVAGAIWDEMGPIFPSRMSTYVAKIPNSVSDGDTLRHMGCAPLYGGIKILDEEISTRGVTYPVSLTYACHVNPVPYDSSISFSVKAKITLNVSNTVNSIGLTALGHLDISATDVITYYPIELGFSYSGGNVACALSVRQNESTSAPAVATVLDSKVDIDPSDWVADGNKRVGYIEWNLSYDSDTEEITSTVDLPGDVTWTTTKSKPSWYVPGAYAGFYVEGTASVADDIYLSFVDSTDALVYGYGPASTNAPDAPVISTPSLAPVRFGGSAFADDDDGDTISRSEWQLTSYADTTYASVLSTVVMSAPDTGNPYADFTLISGNEYRVRVRYYDSYGNASAWSDDVTFTATFSSGSIEFTDLPAWPSTLPPPSDSSSETVEFKTRITPFELVGVESRQKIRATGIVVWHLVYNVLTENQYNILKTFFVDRCGSWGAFNFSDPLDSSKVRRMRFASDSLTREIFSSVLHNVKIDLVELSEYSQQVS